MRSLLFFYFLVFILPLPLGGQNVETLTLPFSGSGGVTLGPDQNIYIADFGASLSNANGTMVWKYNHQDSLEVFTRTRGLSGASGNDFDAFGRLVQSSIASSTISRIDSTGQVFFFTNRLINGPVGILSRENGDIIICNCNGNNIIKSDIRGNTSVFATGQGLFCPNGITEDDEGNMYISNFSNGKVLRMNNSGGITELVTLPDGNNGHLTFANGVLYVCSHGSSKVYEVTLDGDYRTLAGSGIRGNKDGEATIAQFSRPNGIAASKSGDTLYLNSSVPITDAGGRPLNPSLLRMITGVRDFTLKTDTKNNDFTFDLERITKEQLFFNIRLNRVEEFNFHFYSVDGRLIASKKETVNPRQTKLIIDKPQSNSTLILKVNSANNRISKSFKLF